MTETIMRIESFKPMAERFRGYLPVVVDVETGGFDWNRNALLEIAAVPIELDADGRYVPGETCSAHIEPAPGTTAISSSALRFQSNPPVSTSTTTGR
jgi:ribonuclease T